MKVDEVDEVTHFRHSFSIVFFYRVNAEITYFIHFIH